MTLRPITRRVIFVPAALLVLALSYASLRAAIDQLPDAQSAGQKAQTYFQFGYALLGVVLLVAPLLRRRLEIAVQAAWALSVACAGGLASVVWGETSVLIGVVAGISSLLVAAVLVWLLRVGTRRTVISPPD